MVDEGKNSEAVGRLVSASVLEHQFIQLLLLHEPPCLLFDQIILRLFLPSLFCLLILLVFPWIFVVFLVDEEVVQKFRR